MLKKLYKWFRKLFSTKFIHPEVNKQLNTAADDKIAAWKAEYEKLKAEHNRTLVSYIRTYFDKDYSCNEEMDIAYSVCNKAWNQYARKVNSTSKVITLDRRAFENGCKEFIVKMKANAKAKEAVNG